MKRVLIYLLIVVFAIALGLSPVGKWVYSFFGEADRSGVSQLSIKSVRGEYTVYLDKARLGSVKDGDTQIFTKIKPGMHEVKIVRTSSVEGFYFDLIRQIEFLPSSQIEFEWEAGPTLESSSGVVKYFTEIVKPEGAEVLVESFPSDAKTTLDNKTSENKVFEILDGETHKLQVGKSDGFETKDIDITIQDEKSGNVIPNLRLIVEVYLYKQPFI